MNNNLRMVSIVAALSVLISLPLSVWAQTPAVQNVESQFREEANLLSSLEIYNRQMQKQLQSQQNSKEKLARAKSSSKNLERELLPLLTKIVNSLELFIDSDIPFKLQERQDGIEKLKSSIESGESALSNQFRQAFSLYQIEDGYGRNYEAYEGSVESEGKTLSVDFLRLGRLAYYYQTKDGKTSAMWNKSSKSWEALPADHNRHIRKAIRVASKTMAPQLLSLPLIAPEGF